MVLVFLVYKIREAQTTMRNQQQQQENDNNNSNIHRRLEPPSFVCPLSRRLMEDPVMDRCAHTYERASIEAWLRGHECCPISRKPLVADDLVPNHALSERIEKWIWLRETDGIMWEEEAAAAAARTKTSTGIGGTVGDVEEGAAASAEEAFYPGDANYCVEDDDDDFSDEGDRHVRLRGAIPADGDDIEKNGDAAAAATVQQPPFRKARKKRNRRAMMLMSGATRMMRRGGGGRSISSSNSNGTSGSAGGGDNSIPAQFMLLPQEREVLGIVRIRAEEHDRARRRKRAMMWAALFGVVFGLAAVVVIWVVANHWGDYESLMPSSWSSSGEGGSGSGGKNGDDYDTIYDDVEP